MQEMDANQRFAYLFNRFFRKECIPSEKAELFHMLRTGKHDELLRTLINATWDEEIPPYLQNERSAKDILAFILSQAGDTGDREQDPDPEEQEESPFKRKKAVYLRYGIAASLAGLILASSFWYYHHATSIPFATIPSPGSSSLKDQYLTLPDGSKVLLHRGAHIDYPPVFEGSTREVTLRGEAFFDIHSGATPFIVHTGHIKTTVLGTAFNIAYDKSITVTVTRGKVKVENEKGEFSILKGNEQVIVDGADNHIKKEEVDAIEAIAWKKPYLLFNDVSMKEAAQELQRHFGITISFNNPGLENCNVTASFIENESFEEVIKILSKINNMEYVFNGQNKVVLIGEGCN